MLAKNGLAGATGYSMLGCFLVAILAARACAGGHSLVADR